MTAACSGLSVNLGVAAGAVPIASPFAVAPFVDMLPFIPLLPVHATVLSNTVFCSPWQAGQTPLPYVLQYPTCSTVGRAVMRVARLAAAA